MTCAVIIVAAGTGERAGEGIPKQYRLLAGRPVLHRTVSAFEAHKQIDTIIVVVADGQIETARNCLQGLPVELVVGGKSRTESVHAGLKALAENAPMSVLIHDAARPMVSKQVISGVLEGLTEFDAAIPALAVSDALLLVRPGDAPSPTPRDDLYRAQTPQGFDFAKLLAAYEGLGDDQIFADDAAVALHAGMSLGLTPGDPANFKLTYPEDFTRAETMLMSTRCPATGSGFDVHRLEAGDFMMLCGVRVEAGLRLIGHSDADVGLHAITDAVLGAIGEGDIGQHFPPIDDQWKGKDSGHFLKHASNLARDCGAEITALDLTLICERPKVSPYREAMKARVADLLEISPDRINIKATTTEGLGFTGRGEGIAAQAIVTVLR